MSCEMLVAVYQVKENCRTDGSGHFGDCQIFSWRSWGSCNGVCLNQKRSRERVFCCSKDVHPHNLENCLNIAIFPKILNRIKTKRVLFVSMVEHHLPLHLHVNVHRNTKRTVVKVGNNFEFFFKQLLFFNIDFLSKRLLFLKELFLKWHCFK